MSDQPVGEVSVRRWDPTTLITIICISVAVFVFLGPRVNVNVASFVDGVNQWSRDTLHLKTGLAVGVGLIIGALIIALRDIRGSLLASRRMEILKNIVAIAIGAGGFLLLLANLSGGTADGSIEYVGLLNLLGWLGVEGTILLLASNSR